MVLQQLVMQADDTWHTIQELGRVGCTQFIDLNTGRLSHELRFAKPIKLIDETDRRLE